jgi:hypothetical protein
MNPDTKKSFEGGMLVLSVVPWGVIGKALGGVADSFAAKIIARITPGSLPAAEENALLNTLSHIEAGTTPTRDARVLYHVGIAGSE